MKNHRRRFQLEDLPHQNLHKDNIDLFRSIVFPSYLWQKKTFYPILAQSSQSPRRNRTIRTIDHEDLRLVYLLASGYLLPSELFIDIEPTFRFLPSSTSVCIGELALKVVDEAHVKINNGDFIICCLKLVLRSFSTGSLSMELFSSAEERTCLDGR
ncbi:hypothetical protein PGT21_013947 [Puccinia graminis f. sp. tritici]|uniref:Uncharacterized protein n=1 Tax=Puccinia graminis f. sp. tritici TaxID=56615 RepID=A0A5B0P988_PUCGR|nr:hypothetical protein PGT21_013947 [Puccinia graminis f. sp. tritici]KAA1133996.1 hypothetical protein PGTUg99_009962 [Puccinia graminis f. sp. tritici]